MKSFRILNPKLSIRGEKINLSGKIEIYKGYDIPELRVEAYDQADDEDLLYGKHSYLDGHFVVIRVKENQETTCFGIVYEDMDYSVYVRIFNLLEAVDTKDMELIQTTKGQIRMVRSIYNRKEATFFAVVTNEKDLAFYAIDADWGSHISTSFMNKDDLEIVQKRLELKVPIFDDYKSKIDNAIEELLQSPLPDFEEQFEHKKVYDDLRKEDIYTYDKLTFLRLFQCYTRDYEYEELYNTGMFDKKYQEYLKVKKYFINNPQYVYCSNTYDNEDIFQKFIEIRLNIQYLDDDQKLELMKKLLSSGNPAGGMVCRYNRDIFEPVLEKLEENRIDAG